LTEASLNTRRFASLGRLFGDAGLSRLWSARVVVVGIGGVGSWAAEALARSGIGQIDLIDMDHIAESNINRQVHALSSSLGAAKVEAMRARILDISPECFVRMHDCFADAGNATELLDVSADVIIDATDQVRAKAAMAALARDRRQSLVVCGAAGGRIDPMALAAEDIALIKGDALIASLRAKMRRDYGFTREVGKRFGIQAIYSRENLGNRDRGAASNAMLGDAANGELSSDISTTMTSLSASRPGAPLACSGYGSMVTVTAAFGLAAASLAMKKILGHQS
jgi:tRNA threonylcarbamoyladenosine dehydratase